MSSYDCKAVEEVLPQFDDGNGFGYYAGPTYDKTRPKGCYLDGGKNLHWNTHPTPSPSQWDVTHGFYRPVCRTGKNDIFKILYSLK